MVDDNVDDDDYSSIVTEYHPADQNEEENASNLTQDFLTYQLSNVSSISQDRKYRIEKSITHYENMDKGITRMPQFYKSDEFFKCLSQFTMEHQTLKDLGKLKNSINPNDKSFKYELIIENQRGATMFGSKAYSKQSVLYPLDPPKYQTLTGQNLTNIYMYPEPPANWRWSWNNWHVMMINDVDEEGWIYSAIRFGSYHWTGVGKFGNFVRRRIWVRLVERVDNPSDSLEYLSEDEEDKEKVLWVSPNFKDKFPKKGKIISKSTKEKSSNSKRDTGYGT